ncbi:DUF3299 domain-containing protein [Vibrio sp. FNV 38]|nr:DUF3299 domain-containing protein [Vibrio sp. FNV 38]
MALIRHVAACFVVMLSATTYAHEKISWQELVPSDFPASPAFPTLSSEVRQALSAYITYMNAAQRRDLSENEASAFEQSKLQLDKNAVDIEHLIDLRKTIISNELAKSVAINEQIAGQEIEIMGFPAPVEMEGVNTTVFILVPTPGACIHIPPPPSNQMILVEFPQGVEIQDIYQPILVKGQLNQPHALDDKQVETDFADGSMIIEPGYALQASVVLN